MGSSCACPSSQSPITPRPHAKENSSRKIKTQTDIKFADINPVDVLDIEDSQYDLNLLANQIVGRLDEYEKDHGVISRRLRLERSDFQSPPIAKLSFSSSIKPQFSQKERQLQTDALCLEFNSKDKEINLKSEQISESFQSEVVNQKQQSCMLSQRSHILQSSIFTDRLKAKQQFYGKYNTFDRIQLLSWPQSRRQSYVIQEEQLYAEVNKKSNLKLMVLFQAIKNYYEHNCMHLVSYCEQPLGLKLHFNGMKRMLPIQSSRHSRVPLKYLVQGLSALNNYEISQIAFIITGWIPEELRMSQIRSFQGIFERLSGNIQEGNTLVFFSRREQKSIQYASLTKIDLENGLIAINSCGNGSLIPSDFLVQPRSSNGDELLRLQDFIMLIDVIHLNWNPTIYDFCINRESLLTNAIPINRYKLVIPPSSQDIQIRLFVQIHHQITQEHRYRSLTVKLFQFQSMGNVEGADPIRVIEVDKKVFSDVFIFQSCKEKSEYVITVQPGSGYDGCQDIYSTITLYSFAQMYFNEIHSNPLLKQISVQAKIAAENIGFGINSPYFTKNLQFAIEAEPNRQLTVSVTAQSALSYQICLIPDPDNRQILTQLNLQSIISNSLVSHQKHGVGSFTIQTTCRQYILVINSFTEYEGDISIACQLRGKPNSKGQPVLSVKRITTSHTIIFFQPIKWLPSHFGPRKRLKSNSNNLFQPAEVFSDFFKNPCIEKELKKGRYQFFVKSETFKEYFDSVEQAEKNECEPPALSMSVLEVSSDKKQYKIIVDDAYYVPFGIGFWTQIVDIQEGIFRFVFPKMDKSFAVGIFGIVKC